MNHKNTNWLSAFSIFGCRLCLLLFLAVGFVWPSLAAQNFNEIIKATASDRGAYGNFGHSVSISGDYAIVGAYQEDEAANGGFDTADGSCLAVSVGLELLHDAEKLLTAINAGSDILRFSCSELGTQTVRVIATNANGGVGITTFEVTVVDTVAPVLSCTAVAAEVSTDGDCQFNGSPGMSTVSDMSFHFLTIRRKNSEITFYHFSIEA